MSNKNSNGSCGCVGFIIAILFFWTIFFGLSTSSGKLHIDIFPPFIGIDNSR